LISITSWNWPIWQILIYFDILFTIKLNFNFQWIIFFRFLENFFFQVRRKIQISFPDLQKRTRTSIIKYFIILNVFIIILYLFFKVHCLIFFLILLINTSLIEIIWNMFIHLFCERIVQNGNILLIILLIKLLLIIFVWIDCLSWVIFNNWSFVFFWS
jgi:hypothetical protein